jgi:hypothetical protein
MAEMLKMTADLIAARETAARLVGEFQALQTRPWWRRLAGLREPPPSGLTWAHAREAAPAAPEAEP